jgi:DNA repair protein RecN (Recombination protein N)
MLLRLALKDFVIVTELEVSFDAGFSVLTGETGAGKSILIDALQLVLGARGDASVVREGAGRAEIAAEFDAPHSLAAWLERAGFSTHDAAEAKASAAPAAASEAGASLMLRRSIDAQGRSRAWVNGSVATVAQLRELAEHLVEIHGQHAWQRLSQGAAARALLDAEAGVDSAGLAQKHAHWRRAQQQAQAARTQQDSLARERERLQWQLGEVQALDPSAQKWRELNEEHSRLSHAQALLDAARSALDGLSEAEDNAQARLGAAESALAGVQQHDARLAEVLSTLQQGQSLLQDAAHSLRSYLHATEPDPQRLAELDAQLSAWLQAARRWKRPPAELPHLVQAWREELQALEANADLRSLEAAESQAAAALEEAAAAASRLRHKAAAPLGRRITQAMQGLGLAGAHLGLNLQRGHGTQAHGFDDVELVFAAHVGGAPRPLAKVASGGELSRIALAIAVSTAQAAQTKARRSQAGNDGDTEPRPATLIFDEIDSGIGGAVAETVGRQMKALGRQVQVLAVTHLAQVAACADGHHVVAKHTAAGQTRSDIVPVQGEARVAEIARMLGGESLSGTAHARTMLSQAGR